MWPKGFRPAGERRDTGVRDRCTVKIEAGLAWKRHVERTNDRISFS